MKSSPMAADFLKKDRGSQEVYQLFKDLLANLEDAATRIETLRTLRELHRHFQEVDDQQSFQHQFHFSFAKIMLGRSSDAITLLQLPSIFAPEQWSFTFYEGLSRYHTSDFYLKDLVELGCGNGWISIALALYYPTRRVFGFDINPRAITCAKINSYLNGFHPDESERRCAGSTLWDKLSFATSDLLSEAIAAGLKFDFVIGCIPQVLAPDAEALLEIASEADSDAALYDLSNYTAAYGYVEDQFGLGLIVKTVEQAVQQLNPGGKLILNLGGRPGHQILEGLFLRRGLLVERVWSTRVSQASDTEIAALVAIEASSSHRFEFFMNPTSAETISAGTAAKFASQNGEIWHALSVYEATFPELNALQTIFSYLALPRNHGLMNSIDLSSADSSIYRERVRFLEALAQRFTANRQLPYEDTAGSQDLRVLIQLFLQSYYKLSVDSSSVLIAPGRIDLLTGMLMSTGASQSLCDQEFLRQLQSSGFSLNHLACEIVETPRDLTLTEVLIAKLRPDFVLICLDAKEQQSLRQLTDLIESCRRAQTHLCIDVSEVFELSSQPLTNALFIYMSRQKLPSHVSLVCGLIRNRVYQDLELAFIISESPDLITILESCAELTYSRSPLITQIYYMKIFDDLLSFHLSPKMLKHPKRDEVEPRAAAIAQLPAILQTAMSHAAIKRSESPLNPETLRLDYGENALPMPAKMETSIYEAFLRPSLSDEQTNPSTEILQVYAHWFPILAASINRRQLSFGNGVAPLFAAVLSYIRSCSGSVLMPSGSYGEFDAAIALHGVTKIQCQTTEANHFKLSPKKLHQAIDGRKNVFVYLNMPTVNPTGAIYSSQELAELQKVVHACGASLICDSIFLGLEFNTTATTVLPVSECPVVILGGVSKRFAAGGLRFAFSWTNIDRLAANLSSHSYSRPHRTVCYAVKQVFTGILERDPGLVADLSEQNLLLASRAQSLTDCLESSGWTVLRSGGGLFLIAKPQFYGRSYQGKTLTESNVADVLLEAQNVLINGPDWTQLPGYCRFVLAVEQDIFLASLERLRDFYCQLDPMPSMDQ